MPEFIPLTVTKSFRDAGIYPVDDADGETFLEEDDVLINGKTYKLSKLQKKDVGILADELDNQLRRQNPLIQDMFGRAAINILDLVRMVNINTRQGFKGVVGSGNELDMLLMGARTFYDPDTPGSTRTTWVRTIAAIGSKNFIEGANTGAECTMAEEEGFILLGLYNPALDPCVDALKITMNTEPYNAQTLDFNQAQLEYGDPIIELKEPWTLPPEQSGEVESYYFQTGTDEMQAIGLWIKQARTLRDITLNGLRSTSTT